MIFLIWQKRPICENSGKSQIRPIILYLLKIRDLTEKAFFANDLLQSYRPMRQLSGSLIGVLGIKFHADRIMDNTTISLLTLI